MKIAVISPNPHHLQEIASLLEGAGHQALAFDGGKSRMREIAETERPDLMLVDGICRDPQELAQVEHVTSHHPGTAVLLLCSSHTPDFLLGAMRAGVREVLPSPAPKEPLIQAVDRVASKLKAAPLRRGRVLAFVGCKGGSGATFLATNLGWQLAQSSTVLMIDLNLQFGDALSLVHDGRPLATLADVARDIGRLDASLLSASTVKPHPNFSLLPAPEDLALAAEVRADHVSAILALAVANYDFVVLDLPRSLDAVTIGALDRCARIFAVMQAALPDLRNATRLVKAFRSLGYADERVEIILNRHEKTSAIGLAHIQDAIGPLTLHTVGNAWKDVAASINHGEPLAKSTRGSGVMKQVAELARQLQPPQEDTRGLLGRLFRRA